MSLLPSPIPSSIVVLIAAKMATHKVQWRLIYFKI